MNAMYASPMTRPMLVTPYDAIIMLTVCEEVPYNLIAGRQYQSAMCLSVPAVPACAAPSRVQPDPRMMSKGASVLCLQVLGLTCAGHP